MIAFDAPPNCALCGHALASDSAITCRWDDLPGKPRATWHVAGCMTRDDALALLAANRKAPLESLQAVTRRALNTIRACGPNRIQIEVLPGAEESTIAELVREISR